MIINAFIPPVFEAMPVIYMWWYQRKDQDWEKDPQKRLYKSYLWVDFDDYFFFLMDIIHGTFSDATIKKLFTRV